jgi:hypothetical protein
MKTRFQGGPWDGVEFEVSFTPDLILFRHMNVAQSLSDQLGIPKKDQDNPEFDNPLRAVLDIEPVELQDRKHLGYEKDRGKGEGVAIYRFTPNASA